MYRLSQVLYMQEGCVGDAAELKCRHKWAGLPAGGHGLLEASGAYCSHVPTVKLGLQFLRKGAEVLLMPAGCRDQRRQ